MMELGEFIDAARVAQLGQAARQASQRWLGLGGNGFAQNYNRKPFLVGHKLHTHPLFERSALFELCRRLPAECVGLRAGKVPVDEDFAKSFVRYNHGLELEDVLDHFEERAAYIIILDPERDRLYRNVIEGLIGEIIDNTESIDSRITWYTTVIFISSRDSLTPYHMDRELNFLLQICGSKLVKVWDPADSEVVSTMQKDALLAHETGLPSTYSPSIEYKALRFELRPGLGVHLPFTAPHVVNTASDFSVSLALNFRTRKTDTLTAAHRLNHALRKRGWKPGQVGLNHHVDLAKASLMWLLLRSREAAQTLGKHRKL